MRQAELRAVGVVLVAAGWAAGVTVRAEGTAAPSAALFPHRDILPDTMPAAAESVQEGQKEIRHPGEGARANSSVKNSNDDQQVLNRRSATGGLGRLADFAPLLAVLLMILAGVWALRRFMPARRLISGSGVMEILARLPLSGKQSLVLIKLGQRLVLVGVSPERVNTVCLVDDPEQVALLIGRIAHQSPGSMTDAFGGSLDQETGAFGDEADEPSPFKTVGPIRGLLEKVRRMRKQEVA